MKPSPPTRALYIGARDEGTFALYEPPAGQPRPTAVLICPPFGWEPMCPYRSRRALALHLAGAGHPVLRIDLPGSGDSAGGPRDTGRLRAWSDSIAESARWLLAESGAQRVAAVGIGLGGLLAHHAAVAGAPLDDLILWAVPARGRSLVRELRAYALLPSSKVTGPQDPGAELVPEGAVMAAGYLLSAESAADLETLDLTAHPPPRAAQRRVLMIGRTGTSVDEALRMSLQSAGSDVSVAAGPGYRPVAELLPTVEEWLARGEEWPARGQDAAEPTPGTPAPGGLPGGFAAAETLEIRAAGAELRERPMWIEHQGVRLFGVMTEPVQPGRGLCAVLLNPGPQRHIGPSRMWVELARRWAARGVPTFRVDLARIGDSDGDASELGERGALYRPEYLSQTAAVLDAVGARGIAERFVLVGLCSGAYWAMQTALRDERVASIAMVNPTDLIWSELSEAVQRTHGLSRRVLRGSTWRKVLTGEIPMARYLQVTRSLATRAARRRAVAPNAVGARHAHQGAMAHARLFDSLRERGQDGLLVFTRAEALFEQLRAGGLFDGSERWPNLRLELLETSEEAHLITSLWLQQSIHALLDEALDRELHRLHASTIALSA